MVECQCFIVYKKCQCIKSSKIINNVGVNTSANIVCTSDLLSNHANQKISNIVTVQSPPSLSQTLNGEFVPKFGKGVNGYIEQKICMH